MRHTKNEAASRSSMGQADFEHHQREERVPIEPNSTSVPTPPAAPPRSSAPLLFRPTEAAHALGLGRSTIYELMRSGELPVIHIGRAARIPCQAVEAWISERVARETGHRIPLT